MLTLTNISKTFSGSFKPVLRDINLHLNQGEFCILIGSNGSGKSTLMKLISGEYAPDTGSIMMLDKKQVVASVIQDVNQGTIPEMTLLENMVLSLSRTKKASFSLYQKQEHKIAKRIEALGLGLEAYIHRPLSHLSGGQRQMVATLMALSSKPQLLLLDEHTSALDPSMQRLVMDYTAAAITEQKLTSLMITHNLGDAIQYGNRLIMLHQGQIVCDLSGAEKANLKTHELLALFHNYEDTVLLGDSL